MAVAPEVSPANRVRYLAASLPQRLEASSCGCPIWDFLHYSGVPAKSLHCPIRSACGEELRWQCWSKGWSP